MNDERGRLRSPIHFFCIVVNDTDKVDCGSVMKRRWFFGSSVGENLLVPGVASVEVIGGHRVDFHDDRRVPDVASVEVIGGHRVDFHDGKWLPEYRALLSTS
ncbi:hypothetical protein ACFX15_008962 [Malus domestica]